MTGAAAEAGADGAQSGRLRTVAVVAAWFVLNTAMGSSTKWIFLYGKICNESHGCHTYKFPLTITFIHMVFSWVMCFLHMHYVRGAKADLSFDQQLRKVAPLAACFALSVASGNLSLKYLYPSFNQMLGSMAPLITVVIAMVMQGKRFNAWTWISMPVICGGLSVCSVTEVNFHALGAFYATSATVFRGMKSVIQGRLLSDTEKGMDSVALLFYMSPWAAGLLLIVAVCLEGAQPLLLLASGFNLGANVAGPLATQPSTGGATVLVLLIVSGLNACLLNLANFLVTSHTNAVTLQVLGNVKSCMSIAVSVAIFKNTLKPEQALGVLVCLFGVWLYQKKGGPAMPVKKNTVTPGHLGARPAS
mmetsp:Transcript_73519/g.228636  ORF Transcript_73519/g.228636 Transcript_73519/m.228636 type:complete len:361 (+) Transcript_73519:85-1167(+)